VSLRGVPPPADCSLLSGEFFVSAHNHRSTIARMVGRVSTGRKYSLGTGECELALWASTAVSDVITWSGLHRTRNLKCLVYPVAIARQRAQSKRVAVVIELLAESVC
jgi:hypothetical protein